jgi:hypothetical protein
MLCRIVKKKIRRAGSWAGLRWSGIGPPGGLQEEEIGLIRFVFLEFANYLSRKDQRKKGRS